MEQPQSLKQLQKSKANYQKFLRKISNQKQLLFAKVLNLQQTVLHKKQKQIQSKNNQAGSQISKQKQQASAQVLNALQQIFKMHNKTKVKILEVNQISQSARNTQILNQLSNQHDYFQKELNQLVKYKQQLLQEQALLQNVFENLFKYTTQRFVLNKRENYSKYLDEELHKLQEFKNQINKIFVEELSLMQGYLVLIKTHSQQNRDQIQNIRQGNSYLQKMIKDAQELYEEYEQEEKQLYKDIQKFQEQANSFINPAKKLQNLNKINSNENPQSNLSDLDDAESYYKKHNNINKPQSAFRSNISEGLNYMRQFQQPRSIITSLDQPSVKVTNIEYVQSLSDQYKKNKAKWHLLAFLISISIIYFFITAFIK